MGDIDYTLLKLRRAARSRRFRLRALDLGPDTPSGQETAFELHQRRQPTGGAPVEFKKFPRPPVAPCDTE